MKPSLKSVVLRMASWSGYLELRRSLSRSKFRVVTYHGVDDRTHPVINYDRLQTYPDLFTCQVEALAREFSIVDLGDAVRGFLAKGIWPDRALAITFDDGYQNNLLFAAPILKRIGVPATFFVTAGFVDGRVTPWWYDLRRWLARSGQPPNEATARAIDLEAKLRPMKESVRDLELAKLGVERGGDCFYPLMNRDECNRLIAMGFDLQCHGDTHASFAGESPERVKKEMQASVDFVSSLGQKPWGIAYPYGHEAADLEAARAAMTSLGLSAALTTREGANGVDADPWRLRRWDMHGGYTPLAAVARVS